METNVLPGQKKINFCLYARKSTESDELQALSIGSQTKEMLAVAERDNLKVIDIREESHSAKNSGERPIFWQMIEDIKHDKIQGILTWAPDRLSRNAGDLGIMVDLMDQHYLLEIRTFNQIFTNSPNDKFLLMILGSQAKLENDNKAINVVRGLKAKCEMGFRPGMTPLGYLNDKYGNKGQKEIVLDPVRAPLIKEMFIRSANGQSGRKILNWLNSENFTTRSGKRIALCMIYRMLANTYYYGKFEFPAGGGNWYNANHESIISQELFEEVKQRLADTPKRNHGTKEFDFTKVLKCGACGSGICAEEKFKSLKNGSKRRYVYYHCTGGKDRNCKQSYVREETLIDQLTKLIDKISISQLGARDQLRAEIDRYERFTQGVLKQNVDNKQRPKVSIKEYAKYVLQNGTREEKRELLSHLQTKIYLKDRVVYTTMKK
jgi:site-specific DNA recombinase